MALWLLIALLGALPGAAIGRVVGKVMEVADSNADDPRWRIRAMGCVVALLAGAACAKAVGPIGWSAMIAVAFPATKICRYLLRLQLRLEHEHIKTCMPEGYDPSSILPYVGCAIGALVCGFAFPALIHQYGLQRAMLYEAPAWPLVPFLGIAVLDLLALMLALALEVIPRLYNAVLKSPRNLDEAGTRIGSALRRLG